MRLIFVVAREQEARGESLRASLVGAEDVLIVMDRRQGTRRKDDGAGGRPIGDRRTANRRRTDVDPSLRAIGWALVEQAP